MNYPYLYQKQPQFNPRNIIYIIIAILIFLVLMVSVAKAEEWTNEQIANAIYRAENSKKYPYGIKSIPTYGNKEYARKICLNTIRNHKKRHSKHSCGLDFISCLGKRYCPTTIKSEYRLNKNWIHNVKFYLAKQ